MKLNIINYFSNSFNLLIPYNPPYFSSTMASSLVDQSNFLGTPIK